MFALALFALAGLVIDGKLDDAFWKRTPVEQFAPSGGGTVRAVVAGRYLYIAAELPEPTGRITARSIGRNPAWEDEDLLRVAAGADIGYTDRVLQVNPLGAYSLERAGHVVWKSLDIYPYSDERIAPVVGLNINKFLVASQVGEKSWTVEIAFPLSELSAPGNDRIYATIERVRAQRPGSPQQTWRWPRLGPAEKIAVDKEVKWEDAPPAFRPPALGNQQPPIEAGRAGKLPPIESAWDDPAWANVPAWRLLRDEPHPRLPRVPTEVKFQHDGRTLAILARCTEPDKPVASVREIDGPVQQDDSFRVYLATSGSRYVELAVNSLGYLRDAAGFSGGPRISREREWDSGTRIHIRQENGSWLARLDIPLQPIAEALGEERPPADWRILLMRYRRARAGEARETSVLPVIESDTAVCPARYRRLQLSKAAPAETRRDDVKAVADSPLAFVLSPSERRDMALQAMMDRTQRQRARKMLEAEVASWEKVDSRAAWERYRDPRIAALRAWLGEFPQRGALRTQVMKEYQGEGYRRQDLVYLSRPGLWVTANLYLPARPTSGMPGIVIIHSHHRPRTQAELQDMGILWARLGCAVLIMDQIGHGERIQTYPWNREPYHTRYLTGMQLYVAGESLMKWMVWDTMRGIDLLLERPDIDPKKIILLGAVAAGGDPAAVTAAIDGRIAAVVPFTFGESMPELGPGGSEFPGLPDPNWGSWETTRNLPYSISKGFLPWIICASVAPRRFVYSYELGWEVEKVPAWARYRKVFGFYGALDNLDEAHGFGPFPGPGECANIGPAQRKSFYPELKRWFGIPIPEAEPDDRRPEAELAALAPETASKLGMKMIHELAREEANAKAGAARAALAKLDGPGKRKWLQEKWAALLGDIEPNRNPDAVVRWTRQDGNVEAQGITLEVEPGIIVPMVLLRPAAAKGPLPVVLAISQFGKARLLANRRGEIDQMLAGGAAVCLPDLRGIGETSGDARRGPMSEGIETAASELMLGNTLVGARLKDLRTVMRWLAGRPDIDHKRILLWGDSDVPPNPGRLLLDEVAGWRLSPQIERDAEPLGGVLALLGALYEDAAAVAVRRGLAGYLSLLDDPFTYVPSDVIVPGSSAAGDLADIAAALAPRPLYFEQFVDGRNRVLSGAAEGGLAKWVAAQVRLAVSSGFRGRMPPGPAARGCDQWPTRASAAVQGEAHFAVLSCRKFTR